MSAASARPKGFKVFAAAIRTRKSASMLVYGFSSGLPPALLVGTLTAWLGEVGVKLAMIGVLSWIGLTYAFKFLWSPLVDRVELPLLERLGRRKSWIVLCQVVMILSLIAIVMTDPSQHIARFALFAFFGALASATQDIAIDGWRIDVADEKTPVELLSSVYQLGGRSASIVGGAVALYLAARMSWSTVYLVMAALIGVVLILGLGAPDTERPQAAKVSVLAEPGEINPRIRAAGLLIVGISWIWAIYMLVAFMISMLVDLPPGATRPSAGDFLKNYGWMIIAATVFVPLGVAAWINRLKARGTGVQTVVDTTRSAARTAANHLYGALIAPLADLAERMRWGVLVVMALILTYALCYNVWASFAYPFYLDFMHYSKDEVAFASKIFGIIMSIIGVSIGGYLFLRIGRFPTVLIGALLPIFGNFVYADLADGAHYLDAVLHVTRIDLLAQAFGGDLRMARLLLTICYENISTGIAGAALVAFMSGVVSKKFAAVQYAVLSSLTFLVGALMRAPVGEAIPVYGYGNVFRWLSLAGVLAIAFVLIEWWRASRAPRVEEPGHTGERA
ncbi:AmpG family muropeptide MFS transporter [Sphingomonas sp.]|jgi:PAT family beta-lactamase induction signal transducer AmpG|uniref:AmpG family muropeptide MFS transporter n=1 Tax=Sphingomonas sp. TaxID=28214 RepID=UPI002E32443F|nr:MFS transporter [Sphingomonas sp.]HEX4693428.1 MFS transporter [Sphingomonas sp.]